MFKDRFSINFWNPFEDFIFCFCLHSCNKTIELEAPGFSASFYFGRGIDG